MTTTRRSFIQTIAGLFVFAPMVDTGLGNEPEIDDTAECESEFDDGDNWDDDGDTSSESSVTHSL